MTEIPSNHVLKSLSTTTPLSIFVPSLASSPFFSYVSLPPARKSSVSACPLTFLLLDCGGAFATQQSSFFELLFTRSGLRINFRALPASIWRTMPRHLVAEFVARRALGGLPSSTQLLSLSFHFDVVAA